MCPARPAWPFCQGIPPLHRHTHTPTPHPCAHTLTATRKTGRGGLHAGLGTRVPESALPHMQLQTEAWYTQSWGAE